MTLLVPSDLPEFVAFHVKQHTWTKLRPEKTSLLSWDARAKAVAQFHLVDAEPSPHWEIYQKERMADEKRVANNLAEHNGEDIPFIYGMIENAADNVLACADLERAKIGALHDCILPLSPDVSDDGWGNVSWQCDIEESHSY